MDAPCALWDEAPCGLLVADANGRIVQASATFCTWLGYAPAELVGIKRLQELLPMGARVFLQTHWTPLLQMQGSVSEVQLDFNCRDGKRIPMMLNAIRRTRDGEVRDEIAALVASDRKLYERELLAARGRAEDAAAALQAAKNTLRDLNVELSDEHRRKDIFLATLAHELRNPLAPMANVVEVLRLEESSSPRQKWVTDILARQVAQMAHLVDDLLDVSRITEGKVELRRARVDLADILRLAAEEARPAMQAAGQTLTLDIVAGPVWLDADQTRLTQIAANLLNNANKYSPAGSQIGVRAWTEAQTACFDVCDDGIGIPVDQLAAIFGMFSQLEPMLERATGGLGIGLALVKGLIDLHQGTIAAHSDGPGTGSCFSVRLPLAASQAAKAPEPAGVADAAPAMTRVAVVDDNADAADTLAMALGLFDYQTSVAYSGGAGIEMMASFRPHVAVLDVGLPDMSGYDLARQIRARDWGRNMILIAATGWGQDSDKQTAMDAGFDAHLTKPVDFTELQQTINQLLQTR